MNGKEASSLIRNYKVYGCGICHECDDKEFEEAVIIITKAIEAYGKIKAIIDGWAVDDDEHLLLEKIADIVEEV